MSLKVNFWFVWIINCFSNLLSRLKCPSLIVDIHVFLIPIRDFLWNPSATIQRFLNLATLSRVKRMVLDARVHGKHSCCLNSQLSTVLPNETVPIEYVVDLLQRYQSLLELVTLLKAKRMVLDARPTSGCYSAAVLNQQQHTVLPDFGWAWRNVWTASDSARGTISKGSWVLPDLKIPASVQLIPAITYRKYWKVSPLSIVSPLESKPVL